MGHLPDIDKLLLLEGGYSNHKDDLGGETKYGITHKTALANGYTGSMIHLTKDRAKAIYYKEYWFKPNFHRIAEISYDIADTLFNTGVLIGKKRVAKFFQKTLNLLNQNDKFFNDIEVDGLIGQETIRAFRTFTYFRGNQGFIVIEKCLRAMVINHYIKITEKRPENESFFYGWVLHRG